MSSHSDYSSSYSPVEVYVEQGWYPSKGGATVASTVATIMLIALAAVPVVGAYGFARAYGASVPVAILAGVLIVAVLGLVWRLARRVSG